MSDSKMYAISARVQIEHIDAPYSSTGPFVPPRVWTKTVELPTFYLLADVQGIVSEDHARMIAVDMIASLGHLPADINLQVTETSMEAHR